VKINKYGSGIESLTDKWPWHYFRTKTTPKSKESPQARWSSLIQVDDNCPDWIVSGV